MSGLVLTIRKFNDNKGRVRFDWNLRSNGQIVSTSHRQGYSRRIDCARGAEVGAGVVGVQETPAFGKPGFCYRFTRLSEASGLIVKSPVMVRIIDERAKP